MFVACSIPSKNRQQCSIIIGRTGWEIEPRHDALGQLRNSRPTSLSFAALLCSADFRLVFASRTAHWADTRLRPSAMRFPKTVEAERYGATIRHEKRPFIKDDLFSRRTSCDKSELKAVSTSDKVMDSVPSLKFYVMTSLLSNTYTGPARSLVSEHFLYPYLISCTMIFYGTFQ